MLSPPLQPIATYVTVAIPVTVVTLGAATPFCRTSAVPAPMHGELKLIVAEPV